MRAKNKRTASLILSTITSTNAFGRAWTYWGASQPTLKSVLYTVLSPVFKALSNRHCNARKGNCVLLPDFMINVLNGEFFTKPNVISCPSNEKQ